MTTKFAERLQHYLCKVMNCPALQLFSSSAPSGNLSRNTRKCVNLTQDDAEVARRHKRFKTGDSDATQAKEGLRKRSAKSTSDSLQLTLDQIFVPKTRKKRKKEEESEICGGCKSS